MIADALDAPRNYMSKTLGLLAREGLITGARGPTGGFRLERSPGELTLAEVVRAVRGAGEPVERVSGGGAAVRWKRAVFGAPAVDGGPGGGPRADGETVIADLLGDPDGAVQGGRGVMPGRRRRDGNQHKERDDEWT
jgi:hypothetical protein